MRVILLHEIPNQQIVYKVGCIKASRCKIVRFPSDLSRFHSCARTAGPLRWCTLQRANKGSSFPIALDRTTPAITNLLPVVLRIHDDHHPRDPTLICLIRLIPAQHAHLYLYGIPIVDSILVYLTQCDHHGKSQGMVSTCCSHLAYKFTTLSIRVPSPYGSLSCLISHRIYQCDTDVRIIMIVTCANWQVFTVAAYCNLSLG